MQTSEAFSQYSRVEYPISSTKQPIAFPLSVHIMQALNVVLCIFGIFIYMKCNKGADTISPTEKMAFPILMDAVKEEQ